MSKIYTSHFTFDNIQVKSLEKAKLLAQLLDTMEKEFGIKVCKISFTNCFICPDIDVDKLVDTKMELLIRDIVK